MTHLWQMLNILQKIKYIPSKFDPLDTRCFVLSTSAKALYELEKSPYDKAHLSRLVYVTFILGKSFNLPNYSVSIDGMQALTQYMPIAYELGYCDEEGKFYTDKLSPDDSILRSMTNVNVNGIPNFFRAWFLIILANYKVLPKLLNDMEDRFSFKEFEFVVVDYYTHIAEVFIPNLFNVLSNGSVTCGISLLTHLSKLLLDFPAKILPTTLEYTRRMNDHCLNNISTQSVEDIFAVLKLNEYIEFCHNNNLLSTEDKIIILKHIIYNSYNLKHQEILMLMRLKYTIFNELHGNLKHFEEIFSICASKEQVKFNKQPPFQHEVDFFNLIKQSMVSDKQFLSHSYVCPNTGKEIDIAYVNGRRKVAIHIDGFHSHYYLDRQELNRVSKTNRKALENAGWINIDQRLPRLDHFMEVLRVDPHLKSEAEELLGKLQCILPLKDIQAKSKGAIDAPRLR